MLRSAVVLSMFAAVSAGPVCWDNVDCGVNEWCRPVRYGTDYCFSYYKKCTPKRDIGETCSAGTNCRDELCKDGLTCEKGVCTAPKPATCTLKCGTVVPVGWGGNDEGSNACNTCGCLEGGLLRCTMIACPALPCPKPEPKTCTLKCGTVVPAGWGGNDEGSNACNTCGCTDSGSLICTQIACLDAPCPPKKSCELQCGTVVADGWTGKDEGTNDCNTCTCTDGALGCTKIGCVDSKECPKPEPTTCTLGCGTVVPVGWGGHDEGDNACNTCGCLENGLLRCTMIACPKLPCPKPEPETCTLKCGTVVPVGWGGKDEGSNACNSCGCLEGGVLRCTEIACLDAPCPAKKSCELQCGTVVADGWTGKDEGTNDCNTCTCTDGALGCTKIGCVDSKECPKPEPTTCTLGCGTVVPVGWGGHDEGDNACNTCGCLENGLLRCTLIACPKLPCPKPEPTTCTLKCGTVVPVGWGGKDECSNACNSCGCLEGGVLRCTEQACVNVPSL